MSLHKFQPNSPQLVPTVEDATHDNKIISTKTKPRLRLKVAEGRLKFYLEVGLESAIFRD
jgi:hypothetical protein